jgi:putative tricarboxylic transport membrane protein
MVLALILAPRLETQIGRALTISHGDWSALVSHPVANIIFGVAIVVALFPIVARRRRRSAAKLTTQMLDEASSTGD